MVIRNNSLLYFLVGLALAACGGSSSDGESREPLENVGGAGGGGAPSNMAGAAGAPANNDETGGKPGSEGGAPGMGGSTSAGGNGGGPNGMGGASSGGTPNAMGGTGQGGANEDNMGTEGDGDFRVPASTPTDPDVTDQGNPKGRLFEFTVDVSGNPIYPDSKTRNVNMYVPAAYVDGTEAPILIIADRGTAPLPRIMNALDNLTISQDPNRKLPAFIAIGLSHGDRGFEYNTMNGDRATFVHDHVLPAILQNADVKAAYPKIAFTKNPWGRATMGCSSGGSAALIMAWFRPDLYRRVVGYSTSLTALSEEEAMYPLGAWEFHSSTEVIKNTEVKPLRIFVHTGENDLMEGPNRDWVVANTLTAAALKAKNYHYRFALTEGTGHCAAVAYDRTLADTLVWLWRGYQAE